MVYKQVENQAYDFDFLLYAGYKDVMVRYCEVIGANILRYTLHSIGGKITDITAVKELFASG